MISFLCKLMDRMTNVGMFEYFEQKGKLSTLKRGGRAKRTTTDHLLCPEATVRKAQANNEQLTMSHLFCSMEITYNLT